MRTNAHWSLWCTLVLGCVAACLGMSGGGCGPVAGVLTGANLDGTWQVSTTDQGQITQMANLIMRSNQVIDVQDVFIPGAWGHSSSGVASGFSATPGALTSSVQVTGRHVVIDYIVEDSTSGGGMDAQYTSQYHLEGDLNDAGDAIHMTYTKTLTMAGVMNQTVSSSGEINLTRVAG